jgi:choloylglycine hydrolase
MVVTVVALAIAHQSTVACTGIRIQPEDGSIVVARTLEFAADFHSGVIAVPRATAYVGVAPDDRPGLKWTSKYAVLGANMYDLPDVLDGLNEKGLAVAIFYFPGFAKFEEVSDADLEKTIAPWEIPVYLLGNCATVDEAVDAIQKIRVGNVVQSNMGFVPPCHFIMSDAAGHCVVLEYVDGVRKIHKNPLGVITNAPAFDWHVMNLHNYINLTPNNAPTIEIAGVKLAGLGQGSGMLGLPGDFTPPSRFVRAVAFSHTALPVATAREGVLQAFHILNQFDIPKGSARGMDHGQEVSDYTQWTSASDLTNLRYHFRTFENSRIRMIDLKQLDLDAKSIKTFSMDGDEVIEDLSSHPK